jgi:hypothetical protein
MIELPPMLDDDLPVLATKYKVPFKLTESMLCYNASEDAQGRRDLVSWLDVVEEHYRKCHKTTVFFDAYKFLHAQLKHAFPGLDYDCVSAYCDQEVLCPRPALIVAWRAFLVEMNWDDANEPKPKRLRRQQAQQE